MAQEVGENLDAGDAAALATRIVGEASQRGSDPEARTPWIVDTAQHKPELLPWNIRIRPRGLSRPALVDPQSVSLTHERTSPRAPALLASKYNMPQLS